MSILNAIVKKLTHEAQVLKVEPLNAFFQTVILEGAFFREHRFLPGEYLHMLVESSEKGAHSLVNRSYSVWRQDQQKGRVVMAVNRLGKGPGTRWVNHLESGQTCRFTGPVKNYGLIEPASRHIMVGDVSALAHFYHLRQGLSEPTDCQILLFGDQPEAVFDDLAQDQAQMQSPDQMQNPMKNQIQSPSHQLQPPSHQLQPPSHQWFYLNEREALTLSRDPGEAQRWQAELHQALPLEEDTAYYLAGRGEIAVGARRWLMAQGISKKQIRCRPFWQPGKSGL